MGTRNKNVLMWRVIPLIFLFISFVGFYFARTWFYPPNLLLEKPLVAVFTEEDRLKKDWREGGFHGGTNKSKQRLTLYFQEKLGEKRNHYFILTYLNKLPKQLLERYGRLFKHESKEIGDKIVDLYSYSTGKLSNPDEWLKKYDEILAMAFSEKESKPKDLLAIPRDFSRSHKKMNPTKISVEQCASLLKNKTFMEGDTFLFYTGAGLSASAGIPTAMKVRQEAGYDWNKEVDQFAINILTNPQVIIDAHKKFEETFRHVKPTLAHKAIAELAMKYNAHVVTSNVDKLHEQSGVKAWNIMSRYMLDSWLGEEALRESGNFAYLQENPQWLKKIDFIICVGMSHDVKGFLGWYKKYNPKGKIIAVNKSEVPYLGDEDYFLQGDIQEIMPALANVEGDTLKLRG